MTCPDCDSVDTAPIVWGNDCMSKVLRQHYPDARERKACGHGFSHEREAEKQRFRDQLRRIIPSTPTPTD